jgi:hypothetical protein
MYEPITNNEIQVKKPVRSEWGQKVKDNFDYLYGIASSFVGSGIVPNGSFEVDSDNDGVPDNWALNLYPGGSAAFSTANPAHGSQSWKFVHPGGSGNGGGYLDSAYIECFEYTRYIIGFIHWASNAAMKNQVIVRWYDKDKLFLSSDTVYSSTSNPTNRFIFLRGARAPNNATFLKIRVAGGYTDTNQAGSAYFDGITLDKFLPHVRCSFTIDEATTENSGWTDVGSASVAIPYNCDLTCDLEFEADLKAEADTVYIRFRIGDEYSNEEATAELTWQTFKFTLPYTDIKTHDTTIYVQLKGGSAIHPAHGRKTTNRAVHKLYP